jgi:NhaC family Na+:H+ antiporter
MDIIAGVVISFLLLISGVSKGIFVGYPLIISLLIFIVISIKRGFGVRSILKMIYKGSKKSFIILEIFILIGAITSLWMASGTIPGMVYYGNKLISPNYFILSAFLITCFVAFLLGTSFGTVSTIGIVMIVMARAGGVNTNATAGAIIAGAYFGDRMSPVSSSANLVAHLTETDLYENIKNMFKTSWFPFLISTIIYLVISFIYPLNFHDNNMEIEILKIFKINMVVLLPALSILVFSFFKVNVKISMFTSICIAAILGIIMQHSTILDIFKYAITGYEMSSSGPLYAIIKGGGVLSMLKTSIVVIISSAFSGIFEGTGILNSLDDLISKANTRFELFVTTIIVSTVTAAFGCTQALSIILTDQLVKKTYKDKGVSNTELAVNIENTAVLISPAIPWNIAGLVPATTLGVGIGFIPFAFYLFLVPIYNLLYIRLREMMKK